MLIALVVALLAGLATAIGGVLAIGRTALTREKLAFALAFAAGAMLLVSLVELLPLGIESLTPQYGPTTASALGFAAFFAGIGAVLLLDRVIPHPEPEAVEAQGETDAPGAGLLRSGFLVALVLALHNLPEGMATFFTTYSDPQVGLPLAAAIAIHNVPEGVAVAAPVYAATRSRKRAFWWATASGLTEPVGALIALALVAWVIPPAFFGVFYALVAGMMVFLALDELLPSSWKQQTHEHQTVYGMVAGMAVVAASLVLFAG